MKKKIAIFQPNLTIGGIEKSLINFLNELDESKYEVDLYIFNKGDFYSLIPNYVNVIKLKKKNSLTQFVNFDFLYKHYNLKLDEKEYDVAIDYNGYNNICSLGALKVKSKKKIIWLHNDIKVKYKYEWKYRVLYHFMKDKFQYFDLVVGVSKKAVESFKEMQNNIPCKVIPNYINTKEIIKLSQEKVDFKVNKKKINFVCLGRLHYQKGYDLLLPIIRKLVNERKDFHLYFIGDGKRRTELETQVMNLGLRDYVTFLGAKKNPYAYLSQMDALIFNSRYEGQGMVALEAKCLGLDVIMPKHLEKYTSVVKGADNVLDALVEVKKKEKKVDELVSYNKNITKSINEILGD